MKKQLLLTMAVKISLVALYYGAVIATLIIWGE
jgi:hypothetical protein